MPTTLWSLSAGIIAGKEKEKNLAAEQLYLPSVTLSKLLFLRCDW